MGVLEHITFLLLGVVLPAVLFVAGRQRAKDRQPLRLPHGLKIRLYYKNGLLLYSLALLVLVAWLLGGHSPGEIGLGRGKFPYGGWPVGLLLGFVALYGLDLYLSFGSADRRAETREQFLRLGFLPVSGVQYLHFLFLAVAAGVGEEIVYRGFMITYLDEVLAGLGDWRVLPAILLPAVSFGLGHSYQGDRATGQIILMAVIFGFFYYFTRTLWPLMLLHAGVDAVGGLLSWRLLEGREREKNF